MHKEYKFFIVKKRINRSLLLILDSYMCYWRKIISPFKEMLKLWEFKLLTKNYPIMLALESF